MSDESPEVQQLFDLIAKCLPLAVKFLGTGFRATGMIYANEQDLVSGEGAQQVGGRWNPRKIKAVYASLDPVTATHESYQAFMTYGFSEDAIRPLALVALRIKVARLLDITDKAIRRRIGFQLSELVQEDWSAIQDSGQESWTQAIGRGCRTAGFEGLLVPSASSRSGKNLAIFPDKLLTGSYVRIIGSKDLPPHPSQWPK